jgi:hypothetical protein
MEYPPKLTTRDAAEGLLRNFKPRLSLTIPPAEPDKVIVSQESLLAVRPRVRRKRACCTDAHDRPSRRGGDWQILRAARRRL